MSTGIMVAITIATTANTPDTVFQPSVPEARVFGMAPNIRLAFQGTAHGFIQTTVSNSISQNLSGANRHLYAVGLGVTITGAEGASISLCPLDHPLISLDTPGIWKFSLDFVPKKPTVFLNLYNNQWNTNYRYWYSGTWSSRVRVWTGNDLAVPALEGRVPLLAAAATGPGGSLPSVRRGVNVSRPGVLITAFGSSPALKGTLLRIWEVAGKSGNLVVKLPSGTAKTAQQVDLRGRPRGLTIPIKNDRFEVSIKAFAPASFELLALG